jgi:hypothetical protein
MRVAIGTLLALVFLAALVFTTLRETAVSCEVCVDFGGQSACRRSSAADRDQALQMAQSTACAALAGGVTRGLACQRTPPRTATCGD